VIAVGLGVVRQQHVLENAGLVGYCQRVAAPARRAGSWHECLPGKLTGTPELSLSSCTRVRHGADRDLWRCPTPLESNGARQ
jgi:hypothetical protein